MREFTEGFEFADPDPDAGWTNISGATMTRSSSNPGTQNLDAGGNGGNYFGIPGAAGQSQSPNMLTYDASGGDSLREAWIRCYAYISGTDEFYLGLQQLGQPQMTIKWDDVTSQVTILRGGTAGTLVATSGGTVTKGSWHRFEIHYYGHQTLGFCRVYVDDPGTYSSPTVSFSGDTQNEATDGFNTIRVGGDAGTRVDDIAVNSLSIRIDQLATGTPAAGNSITWPGGGAADVSSYISTSGTTGYIIVHNSNHETNPLIDNDNITNGTWTADAVVPNGTYQFGLMPRSGACGDGFVIYKIVTGDVAGQIQLTGTDGNQTDNYALVDDQPVDTTTEGVVGDTNGEYDIYSSSSSLPASANKVNHVDVISYAFKDGTTINTLNGRVRVSSVNYDSVSAFDANVAASAATYRFPFPQNPAGPDTDWTTTQINNLEFGVRMQA